MSNAVTPDHASSKRSRISQGDVPSISLERAMRVPETLRDFYASSPTRPIDIATAVDMTPSSGTFRVLCGAAVGYGLTDGGPNAPAVALTKLGSRAVNPTEEDDDKRALREAALKPTIANRFYQKYDGSPLPPKNIAENVLAEFDVPRDRTGDVYDLLIENARFVEFLKKIKDKAFIDIGGPLAPASAETTNHEDLEFDEEEAADLLAPAADAVDQPQAPTVRSETPPAPTKNAIFVGHGGNKKPLEQLIKVLNEYKIPYKAAVEEPNRARPIPQKVRETMQDCGAAILIFTADKEYFDSDGNSIWRPSENVSHELGAASVLYGERIVVFKEQGIELASNFSSVGYIEFESDKLSDKGLDLFRELVSMGILKFSVG